MAYYSITSKRIIDAVPLHLKYFLLGRYCTELEALPGMLIAADTEEEANSTTAEAASAVAGSESASCELGHKLRSAVKLMAEDPSTAERRATCTRQLDQLKAVRKILDMF
jgi:hypothetical protein